MSPHSVFKKSLIIYYCVLTNYHQLGNLLNNTNFIMLLLWRSDIQNGSPGLKSRSEQDWGPSGGSRGNQLACLFWVLKATPFLCSQPQTHLQSSCVWASQALSSCHLPVSLPVGKVLRSKESCNYLGPTWILQNDFPISRSITSIIPAKSLCWVRWHTALTVSKD